MPVRDWSRWVGIPYEEPFGCFTFVCRVMAAEFGVPEADYAAGVHDTPLARAIALRDGLSRHCERVESPQEGDLILIRPGHIGIVLNSRDMLHANAGHESRIERFNSPVWKPAIEGFYRYRAGQ